MNSSVENVTCFLFTVCPGEQNLPHPAVPTEKGRAALDPSGANWTSGRRTHTDAGARQQSECF